MTDHGTTDGSVILPCECGEWHPASFWLDRLAALEAVAEEAATVAGLDSSFNDDGTPVYPMLTAALTRLAAIGADR